MTEKTWVGRARRGGETERRWLGSGKSKRFTEKKREWLVRKRRKGTGKGLRLKITGRENQIVASQADRGGNRGLFQLRYRGGGRGKLFEHVKNSLCET